MRLLACSALLVSSFALSVGCSAEVEPTSEVTDDSDIVVDTSSPEARRQYDANVAFASSYTPRCERAPASSPRPRVLVTGFGRFMSIDDNATGRIVSTLIPEAPYPLTHPPPPGEVDPPEPQLSVGTATIEVPGVGDVDVCAMILPVYWDLAAILVAKEIDSFRPSFVMMNGVAGLVQPLWLELGATNRATGLLDGSSQLRPVVQDGAAYGKIVPSAPPSDDARGNLLSWEAVLAGATEAIRSHEGEIDGERRFEEIVRGVELAGYPRASNTYLCNNLTYVVGWLMDHPGRGLTLIRASTPVEGARNQARVRLEGDHRAVPRVFVHWPSELASKHRAAGADVMKAILAAQLTASARGDAPTPGDNARADPGLEGGKFF